MAARFWVGGTGNWDAANTTHWSASTGGAGGSSVPGASDTVTLDAASGGGTVTVTADHSVVSVTGGAFTGTLTYAAGRTITYQTFNFSGTGTRSLTLSDANITITGASTNVWEISTVTNLTSSFASSTITLNGASAAFAGGGKIYGTVNLTGSGQATLAGNNTIATLTRTGTAAKTDSLRLFNSFTVSGTFTCNGNSTINRVLVLSDTVGTGRSITAATVSCSNTDFQDITGAGAGSWDFSASTTIGDCGGNSGITFPASVAQYYPTKGLIFDGSQNYVNTGTLGTLGSSFGSGVYIKFTIQTTQTTVGYFGSYRNANTNIYLGFNVKQAYSPTNVSKYLTFIFQGQNNAFFIGGTTNETNFNDGGIHELIYTFNPGTNTLTISIDGTSQAITNGRADGGYAYTNLVDGFGIGGYLNGGSPSQYLSCNVRNFSIGTSAGALYATYLMDQNTGTSVTDSSGSGNNGTLVKGAGAYPLWAGITGTNWSTAMWTTRVPLPQDDVSLGVAFSASQTVTADMPRLGRSIDWTGATGSPTWANSVAPSMYGSINLTNVGSLTGTNRLTLAGRVGNYTITSAGIPFSHDITIHNVSNPYSLNDAFTLASRSITITSGGIIDNGFSCSVVTFDTNVNGTRNILLSGTWTLNQGATANSLIVAGTGLTFDASAATFIIVTGTGTRTFAGGGKTYGTLTYTVAGSTGELDITGSNSFAVINFSDITNARSLKFTNGTTTTIRNGNGFNVRGTSGKLMTIDTITGASTFTLTSPNQQSTDYITPTRSVVDASPKWYAGANSTDGTGNTNWIFTVHPPIGSGGSYGLRARGNLQNLQRLG